MPGVAALARHQYYAHKQNSFWKIMAEIVGFSPDLPYERRLELLKARRIALWNVLSQAERKGSIDNNIKSPAPNDFVPVFEAHRKLTALLFNGQEARTLFKKLVRPAFPREAASLPDIVLPSASPTHGRMRFEEKLTRWREAFTSEWT